jgi:hypothetical protein
LTNCSGNLGLGILAKEPIPGRVKTRLSPPLSAAEAAALYRACLDETLACLATGPYRTTLFYAGDAAFFQRHYPQLLRSPQAGGDLGQRLNAAAAALFGAGHERAALIGSDSPDLPQTLVGAAFAALEEADVAVIPAVDGGYVLIATRCHQPEIFVDIPWSTSEVLAATRAQALRLGLRWREIGAWEDIDDLASLQRLLLRSPSSATARHARRFLHHHLNVSPFLSPGSCAAVSDHTEC